MLKFNGGRGAVICSKCRRIIDTDIGPEEYKQCYKEPVICWRCIEKAKNKKNSSLKSE